MGYTPYTIANILTSPAPALNRSTSSSLAAGSGTTAAIIPGRSYIVLRIAGDPESFSSIIMNADTGVISTTGSTAPGTYTIYMRNTGSYNITEYELTVTEGPPPLPSVSSELPCCARPIYQKGPPLNNTTYTALIAGNTYLGSVRRGPIPYSQLMAMKKAAASKR
jgi:hypothetical protein